MGLQSSQWGGECQERGNTTVAWCTVPLGGDKWKICFAIKSRNHNFDNTMGQPNPITKTGLQRVKALLHMLSQCQMQPPATAGLEAGIYRWVCLILIEWQLLEAWVSVQSTDQVLEKHHKRDLYNFLFGEITILWDYECKHMNFPSITQTWIHQIKWSGIRQDCCFRCFISVFVCYVSLSNLSLRANKQSHMLNSSHWFNCYL